MELIINDKKPMTADQIDRALSELGSLKFSDISYTHKRMRLSEFIKKLFELNNSCNTLHVVNGKVECEAGKRRSMVDIYRICKYYYPRTTNIKVLSKVFKKLNDEKLLNYNTCGQVNRRVFRMVGVSSGVNNPSGEKLSKDEFGLTFEQFTALKDQD